MNNAAGTISGDQQHGYTYLGTGQVEKVTTYSDTGSTVTSQVQYAYNNLGQITSVYQEHGAAVSTATSPKVQYAYDDTVASNVYTRGMRLKYTTYPNGRLVHTVYDGHNGIDSAVGRANKICMDNSGSAGDPIVTYSYNGGGTLAIKDYPTPDIKLDYFGGTSGTYGGMDRFGRITQQHWIDYSPDPDVDVFKIAHGYDRASNRKYADRQVYKGYAQHYTYDNLNRLTTFKAGQKTESGDPLVMDGVASHWKFREQEWTLDTLGNQTAVKDFGESNWYTGQYNKANEYDDDSGDRTVLGKGKPYTLYDTFSSSSTESDYTKPGSGDAFDIDTTTSGYLTFTTCPYRKVYPGRGNGKF